MSGRLTTVFMSLVIAVAVIGFFIGLADGVPQPDGLASSMVHSDQPHAAAAANQKIIPALRYSEIADSPDFPTATWKRIAKSLPTPTVDLYAEVIPNATDKQRSSEIRASRRAFNGAPPVIPHPTENTSDAACYACHSNGTQLAELKASVMSHQYLGNCTQCHAPLPPAPFRELDASVATSFVGLPAPVAGERAYSGAPPIIPHSQWMRENCSACHGGAGWAGMQSTHPWRTNCTQCHAPSAELDQVFPLDGVDDQAVPMLPPLEIASQ